MNEGTRGALGDAVWWTVDEVNEFVRDLHVDCGREPNGDPAADTWIADDIDADTCCPSPENFPRARNPALPPGPDIITSACHVFPLSRTRTNDRFLFLREIGGPTCLKPFLDKLIADGPSSPHWGGTLVIDQRVILTEPITIPSVFTLAGVGINGEGRLLFEGDFGATPAITFQEFDPNVLAFFGKCVMRDIMIAGPSTANKMRGIKIGSVRYSDDSDEFSTNALGRFQFHRVRVANFGDYGMQGGMNTYTVLIDHCELTDNSTNIQLVFQCNSWRIRDCFISGAKAWGVDVGAEITIPNLPPGALPNPQSGVVSDLLISGCRFIGNKPGAIRVQPGHNKTPIDYNYPSLVGKTTKNVVVFGNCFENNATIAVQVDHAIVPDPMKPDATIFVSPRAATRIVSNFFGTGENVSLPLEEDLMMKSPDLDSLWTQLGFNVSSAMTILNTLKARRLDS